jgi:hypothetical protein
VKVQLKSTKAVLLDLKELNAAVHPDDSTWTAGSEGLTITLEKASPSTWHFVSPDEADDAASS